MPAISPDDDALDRRVRAIVEAVDACRRALIDSTIEDKLLAVERLRGWVALEEATAHPQQRGNEHTMCRKCSGRYRRLGRARRPSTPLHDGR